MSPSHTHTHHVYLLLEFKKNKWTKYIQTEDILIFKGNMKLFCDSFMIHVLSFSKKKYKRKIIFHLKLYSISLRLHYYDFY